jgi:hypothetical protein
VRSRTSLTRPSVIEDENSVLLDAGESPILEVEEATADSAGRVHRRPGPGPGSSRPAARAGHLSACSCVTTSGPLQDWRCDGRRPRSERGAPRQRSARNARRPSARPTRARRARSPSGAARGWAPRDSPDSRSASREFRT